MKGIKIIGILFLLISCGKKEIQNEHEQVRFVYDYAELLDPEQESSLSNFLDSIRLNNGLFLVYFSINNFEGLNFDSISEVQFKKLSIADSGGLIFLSRSDAKSRILVGKRIHERISNLQLSETTNLMTHQFREGRFLDGVKYGFTYISTNMTDDPK